MRFAFAVDEGRRIAFGGVGQQSLADFEKLLHANARTCADETDRNQVAFAQALFESVVQFLRAEVALSRIEVVPHHRFVDLHHLIENALVRLGQGGEICRALVVEEAIQHVFAALAWQVHRQALRAEFLTQCVDQRTELRAFEVDLVDDNDTRKATLRGALHHASRAVFDAVDGVDHDGDGFGGGKRGKRRAAEVRVASRVDQIDVTAAVGNAGDGAVDGMPARLFLTIRVRLRGAFIHRALRLDHAPGMEQSFEQAGLAGTSMAG